MLMAENRWFNFLDPEEHIMADKGFQGLEEHHKTILPFKGKQLPQEQQLYNNHLASTRIVVENCIRAIKEWKICGLCLRTNSCELQNTLAYHNRNWVICAAMVNLFRGVRAERLEK